MFPSTIATLEQRSSVNSGQPNLPVMQLDFNQAMRDFIIMFPDLEEGVIEMVLRSNNGAVDVTIDQLLAMSVDNEKLQRRQTRPKESLGDSEFSQDEVEIKIYCIFFF